jgi:hypothetical protein
MSVQASAWAWAVRGLPTHLKLTLLAVADACNADGFGYPGQERIAGLVQCSERQIRYNLAALAKLGLLEVFHRPGDGAGRKSNAYQLRLEVLAVGEATGSVLPLAEQAPPEATGSTAPLAGEATGRVAPREADENPEATGSVAPGNRQCSAGQPEVQRRATGNAAPEETLLLGGGNRKSEGGNRQSGLPTNVSKERQEERKDIPCAARTLGADVPRSAPREPDGFSRFWRAWPDGQRKRGRKMALAAWQMLHLEDQADHIVADVLRRRDHDDFWARGYAPMPQTYLRGARWEDELTHAPPTRSDSPTLRGILALEELKCPRQHPGSLT